MSVERRRSVLNNTTNKRAVRKGVILIEPYPHKVPAALIPQAHEELS